jgi:cytochrome c biogenesis protein CcmG/thiol:disulfide interchange protein DsbE
MFLIPLGIGAAMAFSLIFGVSYLTRPVSGSTTTTPSALVGRTSRLNQLPDLSGATVSLPYKKGSPTILVFFASWCAPCKAELPLVARFYSSQLLHGVKIVGIASNDTSIAATREFARRAHFTAPVLLDTDGTASSSDFNIVGLPDTVAIDARGVIRQIVVGPVTTDELSAMVTLIK